MISNKHITHYESPIGLLEISANHLGITAISFQDNQDHQHTSDHPLLLECVNQLDKYFQKKLQAFNIKLDIQGTDFQKQVWHELMNIPFGCVVSYLDIAQKISNVKAIRAVGSANGKNPIPIIVPCHRVIGANGKLVGYGGGLWRKKWLLQHENALLI